MRLGTKLALLAAIGAVGIFATSTAMAQAATTTSSYYPYTYTQPDGSTLTIPSKPTRVVNTVQAEEYLDLLASIGVDPVGSAGYGANATTVGSGDNPTTGFPEWVNGGELSSTTSLGIGSLNYEQVAALHPDLIIASSGDSPAELSSLEAIAPVMEVGGLPATAPFSHQWGWAPALLQLAPAFDATARADQLIARIDQRNETLAPFAQGTTATNIIPLPSTTFTLITSDADDGSFFDLAGASLQNSLGGGAPSTGSFLSPSPSYEELPELTGSKLLVTLYGGVSEAAFQAQPLYSQIPAVQSGQVYFTNWFVTGPIGSADMIEQLGKTLYGATGLEATLVGTDKNKSLSGIDDLAVGSTPKQQACWNLSTAGSVGHPTAVVVENTKTGKAFITLGKGYHTTGCVNVTSSEAQTLVGSPSKYSVGIERTSTVKKTITKHGKKTRKRVTVTTTILRGALGIPSPAFFGNGKDTYYTAGP